jgi:hypothetical protein
VTRRGQPGRNLSTRAEGPASSRTAQGRQAATSIPLAGLDLIATREHRPAFWSTACFEESIGAPGRIDKENRRFGYRLIVRGYRSIDAGKKRRPQ